MGSIRGPDHIDLIAAASASRRTRFPGVFSSFFFFKEGEKRVQVANVKRQQECVLLCLDTRVI